MPATPTFSILAATSPADGGGTNPARSAVATRSPVGGRDKEIAEVSGLSRLVGHFGAIALGQGELGHVELQGLVLRQFAHDREILVDPLIDGRGAAVGDDSEPDLPRLQIAFAFVLDELEGEHDGEDDDDNQADADRGNRSVDPPARFAFRPLSHAHDLRYQLENP